MKIIGLTGNIASGKSRVAALWRARGIPVGDSDAFAREAVEPGTEGLRKIEARFGSEVLRPDGTLDRARLRSIVFSDPEARRDLEAIVHPVIAALRDLWLAERRGEGHALVVLEIPLLFEAGLEDSVDRIVFVDAGEEERIRRLVEDRGVPRPEAGRMVAAQEGAEGKRTRSHHLLRNEGTVDELDRAAMALLEMLGEGGNG